MTTAKKVLIVTPSLPFPITGAEQSDRAYGIGQLLRLGFEVRVIAKIPEVQTAEHVRNVARDLGVEIIGVPYKFSNRTLTFGQKVLKHVRKFLNPLLLDGAALEYAEAEIQNTLERQLVEWKPDVVWFDYSYLWPLYGRVQKHGVPIITRSINFEPEHFLEEDGRNILNYLKYIPKLISEYLIVKKSDVVLSITPKEEIRYTDMGGKYVRNLPLRGLPLFLNHEHEVRDTKPLKVFFMGSTYNVVHNRKALELVLKDIAPELYRRDKEGFKFYILGRKLPPSLEGCIKDNVEYVGFQNTFTYLKDMDIAVIPSLFGAGMQQKIFEPLTMGIPTVTSRRGMAGYPFENGKEVVFATDAYSFVEALLSLKDRFLRERLSQYSKKVAHSYFSQEALDSIVLEAIQSACSKQEGKV